MREIKFRAWDTQNDDWVANGDVMDLYNSAAASCFLFDNDSYDIPDGVVLLQYTGLKDKNGLEIYEGDIIRNTVRPKADDIGEVVYNGGMYFIVGNFKNKKEPNTSYFGVEKQDEDYIYGTEYAIGGFNQVDTMFEVIGNIYENPELLTKKDRTE